MKPRRRLGIVGTALLLTFATTAGGCMSFDRDGMFHVDTGMISADVIIQIMPTIRLNQFYDVVKGTTTQKTAAAAAVLRSGAGQLPSVVQDRWNAATAPDQYSDFHDALRAAKQYARCVSVMMKIGWGDIGYDWHFHTGGATAGCQVGRDPAKR